jgi:hypothetical protein
MAPRALRSKASHAPAALLLVFLLGTAPAPARELVRGDADASGSREVTDGIRILLHLFSGGDPPPCLDAADLDDDGAENDLGFVRVIERKTPS